MSLAARLGAAGALVAAVIVIAVLVFGSSSPYTVKAQFQNASGLVTGNNVLIGTAAVGTVSGIGLTSNGLAEVTLHLHGVGHLHQGTVARIYEDSLSGIASKYVELEPGPANQPVIRSGQTIGASNTYSEVNLDELFNSLNAKTRSGLSNLIQGEAASLKGKGRAANRTLEYLAPGLASASQVTKELTRDEPSFDGLIVQGAKAMQALASKSDELTQLVSNTSQTAGAIDRQSAGAAAVARSAARRAAALDEDVRGSGHGRSNSLTPARQRVQAEPRGAGAVRGGTQHDLPAARCRPWRSSTTLISNPAGSGDLISLLQLGAVAGDALAARRLSRS